MAMALNGAILRDADLGDMIIDRPENLHVMGTNYQGFIY
jgi:hypothetical protein